MAILRGPERALLLPERCLVGRSRSCDLVLSAGDVSGEHAVVQWPLASPSAFREIVLLWKDGNSRQSEFELMAKECRRLFRASPLTAG